jgi:hypothetical protein
MDITTTTAGMNMTSSSTLGHVPDLEAKLATVTDPDGNVLGLLQDR